MQYLVVKDFVVDKAVCILGIIKTRLHQEDDDITGELCPTGYQSIQAPRTEGTGGSVGLLIRQCIRLKIRACKHSFLSLEYLTVTLSKLKNNCCLLSAGPWSTT